MSIDTLDPQADAANETAILRALNRIRHPKTQRNRELWLLLFANLISGAAVVLVQFAQFGEISPWTLYFAGGLGVLTFALHLILRWRAPDADPMIVPIATVLTGLGIAEIYRLDIAYEYTGWNAYSTRQIVWTAISLVAAIAVVIFLKNYRTLFRYTYLFGLAGVILLLLPLVPFLKTDATADVWISIAGVGSFQPGELAKICLAIFFAGYLVRTRDSLTSTGKRFLAFTWPRMRELGPVLVVWGVSLGIIVFQRDLGTGTLIFGVFIAMLYVATGKTSWILIGLGLAITGVLGAARAMPYVMQRFTNWHSLWDPEVVDPNGAGYQPQQGIFGLAKGGLLGTGLGEGRPYITPVAESDYIIASLGEELGLVGLFAILCLYMLFVSRGLRIGLAGQDDFGKIFASGIAFMLALQVFIMVGGVTGLLPLTGLTTPFLAAGGSSLVSSWIMVALLLRISDGVRRQRRVVIG